MSTLVQTLPSPSDLSPSVLSFLDRNLFAAESLAGAPVLASELRSQSAELDQNLVDLNRRLGSVLVEYASSSSQIHALFDGLKLRLTSLGSSTQQDVGDGEGKERSKRILGEELPAMAKEVARVETVRLYADTALKLDALIGDTEDAVSSTMKKNLKKHSSVEAEDMRLHAINSLKQIEEILASITKTHPKWGNLVSAVDHRVDRSLAIVRPQAIADHRALLSSLKWPPSLLSMNSSSKLQNPLFTMEGDLKRQYCDNFFALCSLQELQRRRKTRQLEGYFSKEAAPHQPLWVIEELVNPISLTCQSHFSKWVDNPEFIFALVSKITRDYVDSMDELLQPQIDKAMLRGYSCREEWISGVVSSLSTYLTKEIFPKYVDRFSEETDTGARISWLHLIDLMISFDKQIKSLIEHSGISVSFEGYESSQNISSLYVFHDRPDWLDLWAQMELREVLDKLDIECNEERNWSMKLNEDFKAPPISSLFLRYISFIIDRSRSLPNTNMNLRWRFLKLVCEPILRKFLDFLLLRCQEAEGLTALTNNDAIIKVTISINAARKIESVLKQWFEDVFFLDPESESLDPEIKKLERFRLEWVEKISVVIFRLFDSLSRDYIKNKRQWQERIEGEGDWTVSKTLVDALDNLRAKISVVEVNMNPIDFVGVWRSLAGAIDRLIFEGVLGNTKFKNGGDERFGRDMEVLFGVFRAWCLRPEGFFPKVAEGLRLLKMSENMSRS